MNVNKLKGKITEKGMNVEQLADAIGTHPSSLYRKLNNFDKFTIGDALKIKEVLSLNDDEACQIFLL